MANKENKSKAELYREERKQRIAKANAKNAKGIEKSKAVAGVVKKVVAIVLTVAIVITIGAYVGTVTGIGDKTITAVKIGDERVSLLDFSYYYSTMYNQTNYMNEQYSQYGMSMGFDSSISPDEQTTKDAEGNEITWADQFKTSAAERAQFVIAFYSEAVKAGVELDEEKIKEIDETIDNYKDSASSSGFSLNAFLKANFGAGFTEKRFKNQLQKEELAQSFYTQKEEEFKANVSEKEITKLYNQNKSDYDYIDLHYYKFTSEKLTAEEGESEKDLKKRQDAEDKKLQEKATKVFDAVTDLESFETVIHDYLEAETKAEKTDEKGAAEKTEVAETEVKTDTEAEEEHKHTTEIKNGTKSSLKSVNAKLADWAYDSKRVAGDKTLIKDGDSAFIVIIDKPSYTGHSVDVRHCLVKFDAADEENVTAEEKKKAKEIADTLLKDWEGGKKTEDSFAKLCTDHSADPGSAEKGGLYDNIRITDSYVEPFLNWSFDESRKVGDVEIVETTYGYHIMYFSKDNTKDLDQYNTIRETQGTADFQAYQDDVLAEDGDYVIKANERWTEKASQKFCKKIKKNIAYSNK